MSPDSSTRPDNKTKPDAYGVLADPQIDPESGGKPRWIDVAVPGEFKKSAASNQDVDVSSFIFGFSFFASVLLGGGSPAGALELVEDHLVNDPHHAGGRLQTIRPGVHHREHTHAVLAR